MAGWNQNYSFPFKIFHDDMIFENNGEIDKRATKVTFSQLETKTPACPGVLEFLNAKMTHMMDMTLMQFLVIQIKSAIDTGYWDLVRYTKSHFASIQPSPTNSETAKSFGTGSQSLVSKVPPTPEHNKSSSTNEPSDSGVLKLSTTTYAANISKSKNEEYIFDDQHPSKGGGDD